MKQYLEKTLSIQRIETYKQLALKSGETRTADRLYALNILYSKELYTILGALEVALRNTFHQNIAKAYGKEDWLSLRILHPKHQDQIDKAIEHLTREKRSDYVLDDLIAQLNFGFWAHLCDRPYEKNLWNRALYKSFPNLGMKPSRQDIEARLKVCLRLRNKIAHLEPIIKYEDALIQDYRNIIQLLYAICPETQAWFQNICHFEAVWNARHEEK